MSKNFMRVKRIIIPTLTAVLILASLSGCASTSQKEMLDLLNSGGEIVLELAVPSNYEESQGEQSEAGFPWTQLALLTTYRDFRSTFDEQFYIHSMGEQGKNGPAYIDLEGNWTNNSTLYYSFMNQQFCELWADSNVKDTLRNSIAKGVYVDIDNADSADVLDSAILNAYYSLLETSEDGYMNPNSTLTRSEFLELLTRADTEVDESVNLETDENGLNGLANLSAKDSWLDLESGSLNPTTSASSISRGEVIYSLMHRYFPEQLEATEVGTSTVSFSDASYGNSIAKRAKLIDEEAGTYPNNWKTAELYLMLENPDKGVTTDMYKAFVLASNLGVIEPNSESRWDEAITRSEAINMIVDTYEALADQNGYITNAMDGLAEGEALDRGETESIGEGGTTGSILPEGLEDIPNSSDVEIPEGEEIVEGTTLTESELEALRSDLGYSMENAEEVYSSIINNGEYTYASTGATVTDVIGSPYDTSWRQMTDAEAQAILNGEAEGNKAAAEAELANGAWKSKNNKTVYFDYYQWLADVTGDMEANSEYIMNPETDIRHANEQ